MAFPKLLSFRPKKEVLSKKNLVEVIELPGWNLKLLSAPTEQRMKRVILVCRVNCKPEAVVSLWSSGRISCTGDAPECRRDSQWCDHRELVKKAKLVSQEEIEHHAHVTRSKSSDSARWNAPLTATNGLPQRVHLSRDRGVSAKPANAPERSGASPRKLIFKR